MLLRTSPPKPAGVRRAAGRMSAVLALIAATLWLAPAPAAQAAVPLERVSSFGANPGGLNMYVYRPAGLPAHPAVVVALHGCTQSARIYADNSGLTTYADRHGFLLVLAETTSANNPSSCFNWFQATDNRRGQGEAASVRQMVAHAESAYGADAARTYVTGLSAGGGMTSVMLAAYPDVFEAGAVIAGLPYECTKDTGAFTCMNPGVDRTPAVWAQRVRDAYPAYSGPWPRVAIWHGDNDPTVVPGNADELRDQWTAVHGVDQNPDRTSTIGPNRTRREQYPAADGRVVVEVDRVPSIGHGTPVDPGGGPQQCGQTGTANFIDSICSGYWITEFFGLDGSAPDPGGMPAPSGLTSTGATQTSITLSWTAVDGAAGYAVYRDGTRIATPSGAPFTDTGLSPGTRHDYSVAARDAAGADGVRSGPVTATTTGDAAVCWTADNYHQVQAGRATSDGSYAYAKGSQQNMGLYNTFVTHTLKESPVGHFVVADANCP
ncbi:MULTISPECIES: PHB depolymerase family esterase [unclassified Streptomyces]|uniref:extracellular catalytic domain type 1 short-chain-length polyhydroxyalkanoate depolymerase n=1 Tax=unclassified Streptomyces TaxID=2593676 RepID=UPI002DDAE066|nr:PHB depolymerase family esterase [Streptomyces sp. NBC_01750]WSA98516.1 PHB depolymerase family esterase [Streptomyces sp. NBC_01794]WSD36947.1 PHB depolymerase family esterase [Streptomyces sp. NBC_01750]